MPSRKKQTLKIHFAWLIQESSLVIYFGKENNNDSITSQVPAVKCSGLIHGSKTFVSKSISSNTKIISFIV